MHKKSTRVGMLPPEETALFCEQISTLLAAGIPLHEGMETLSRNGPDEESGVFAQMNATVLASGTLAAAVTEAGCFPDYMCDMVAAGEGSGRLEEVTARLSRYYRREAELRGSIVDAVVYPAVLAALMAIVVGVLVIGVLPVFERVLNGLGASYGSSATAFGGFFGRLILVLVGLLLALIAAALLLFRTKHRDRVTELLFRIRPIGRAAAQLSASRLASVCGIALASGGDLEQAMSRAGRLAADQPTREKIERCREQLASGESFSVVLADSGIFDPLQSRMIRVSAAAGKLDSAMAGLEQECERSAERSITALIGALEPTLVAVLSLVVGGILLTVMMPLLEILGSMG